MYNRSKYLKEQEDELLVKDKPMPVREPGTEPKRKVRAKKEKEKPKRTVAKKQEKEKDLRYNLSGIKLVFDLDYVNTLSTKQTKILAKKLEQCW